ncbi:MAG: hypothetical protein ACKVRO_13815 [Micropepsaceae bacterium]
MLDKILAPIWQTPIALVEVLGLANLGTTLVGLFLFIAALEFLRSSSGAFETFARVLAVGAALFTGASLIYGDFMAPTAKAVYARVASRMPADHTSTMLAASFGAATAGVALSSARGRIVATPPPRGPRAATESRSRLDLALVLAAADPARIAAMDTSSRIQLRLLTNRPAKSVVAKVPRERGLPRNGAPAFWRVRRV